MIQNQRNYGIELLRLVLMFMVCTLHALAKGGVLSSCSSGTLNYYVYWFMEICAYCAVDAFALISGYTAKDKPVNYAKIIDMWFQAVFYSFVVTFVFVILGKYEWGTIEAIKMLMPLNYGNFWYFTAYIGLFVFIPILNKFIFSVSEDTAVKTFIIIFIMFSCGGIFTDPFNVNYGYSTIWLIILYCLGGLAKRINLFEKKRTSVLVAMFLASTTLTWITLCEFGSRILIEYTSPTIVLNGILLLVIFSRITIKGGIISKLSPLAFGIYLFQINPVIWNNYIGGALNFVVNQHIILGVIFVLCGALCIFVSGLFVEFIRSRVAAVIKIHYLSKIIVKIVKKCTNKISVLL